MTSESIKINPVLIKLLVVSSINLLSYGFWYYLLKYYLFFLKAEVENYTTVHKKGRLK